MGKSQATIDWLGQILLKVALNPVRTSGTVWCPGSAWIPAFPALPESHDTA